MTKNAHHMFSVEDAIQYGAEKAVLLQNIRFWLDYSQSNGSNVKKAANGTYYYWTYNSATAFGHLFPYMSTRTIERHLKQLIEMGVLIKECHNKATYDRTSWYTTADYESSQKHVDSMHEKSQMNAQKVVNERTECCEPIPNINSNKKTNSPIGEAGASTKANKVIDVFYKHNKSINYANSAYRKAAGKLIERYDLDKAVGFAEAAMACQGQPYAPVINNPIELSNKLIALKGFYEKTQIEQSRPKKQFSITL